MYVKISKFSFWVFFFVQNKSLARRGRGREGRLNTVRGYGSICIVIKHGGLNIFLHVLYIISKRCVFAV